MKDVPKDVAAMPEEMITFCGSAVKLLSGFPPITRFFDSLIANPQVLLCVSVAPS